MKNIYVTGFIGSDRYSLGRQLAEEKGMELIILDKFIEELDGRSVMRIIMLMGEHEYRNKEYEALEELSKKEEWVKARSSSQTPIKPQRNCGKPQKTTKTSPTHSCSLAQRMKNAKHFLRCTIRENLFTTNIFK